MYAAIIATLVIGLLIAYFFLSSSSPVGKSNKGTTITLVGAVNSGKTALFTYLRDGKASTTFTSMAPNEVNVSSCKALASVPGAQSLKLVDIPGHGRFANLQSIHFPRTRVIIFTVDARNDMLWKEVGEKLYTVLTSATLVKRHVPVIIACTKVGIMMTMIVSFYDISRDDTLLLFCWHAPLALLSCPSSHLLWILSSYLHNISLTLTVAIYSYQSMTHLSNFPRLIFALFPLPPLLIM